MKLAQRSLLYILVLLNFSCKKFGDENVPKYTMLVEGVITDKATNQPIENVKISVDAIKASSGFGGIIDDGKRLFAGKTTTDSKGYYKLNLEVFTTAESLEFRINELPRKDGYVALSTYLYLPNLKQAEVNKADFQLSSTEIFKIHYKNAQPVSDDDYFTFHYSLWDKSAGPGATRGLIQKEECGMIPTNNNYTWTGKEVCGIHTFEGFADHTVYISWTVRKAGVTKQYQDSLLVSKGKLNEFFLNY